MIYHNLLPDEYAADVRHEKLSRFFTLLFSSMAVAVVIVLVLLLPPYFSLSYEQDSIGGEIEAAKQGVQSKRVAEAEDSIKALNKQVSGIADYRKTPVAGYFGRIANDTPAGITLATLSYSKANATITVQGVANRRDDLLAFITTLKNESTFSSLDSPITNLLKETGAAFHITVTIADAKSVSAAPTPVKPQAPEVL